MFKESGISLVSEALKFSTLSQIPRSRMNLHAQVFYFILFHFIMYYVYIARVIAHKVSTTVPEILGNN